MTHDTSQHERFEQSLRVIGAGVEPECAINSMLCYIVDIAQGMDEFEATMACMAISRALGVIALNMDDDDEDDEDDLEQDEA